MDVKPEELIVESWPERPVTGMIVGLPKGVKITHKPTGYVVTCDTERSQHANRDKAWAEMEQALRGQQARDKARIAMERVNEAMRLAGMLSTARVLRYRVYKQGATFMSKQAADARVVKAEAALRAYVEQFQTVSDAHTTQGEKK